MRWGRSLILTVLFLIILGGSASADEVATATVNITMGEPAMCVEGTQEYFQQQDGTVQIKECVDGEYTRLVDTCSSLSEVKYLGKGKYACEKIESIVPSSPSTGEIFLESLSTDVILLALLASILIVGGVISLRIRGRPK